MSIIKRSFPALLFVSGAVTAGTQVDPQRAPGLFQNQQFEQQVVQMIDGYRVLYTVDQRFGG